MAPNCPECASPNTEQVEAGSDYASNAPTTSIFQCLDCGAEFSPPEREPSEE